MTMCNFRKTVALFYQGQSIFVFYAIYVINQFSSLYFYSKRIFAQNQIISYSIGEFSFVNFYGFSQKISLSIT